MQGGSTVWVMMVLIVILNTIAQSLFKMGAGHGLINGSLAGGVVAYGLSTLLYVVVLGRANLSFVYPVAIGATAIATCLASVRVFGEKIGVVQWLGVALIIGGIVCIAAFRSRST